MELLRGGVYLKPVSESLKMRVDKMFKSLLVIAVSVSMVGCAGMPKSYFTLEDECSAGNSVSCTELQGRNQWLSAGVAGLNAMNQQQQLQIQQQQAAAAAMPKTINCNRFGNGITCTQY
ncbi:hypothetical protein N4X08_004158 [Salmonella enterica]|nr:hypothetical protein [Salmonella enterica]